MQFTSEDQPQYLKISFFLKNKPIHLQFNRTTVIRPVKENQLTFPSIEINKQLLDPVHRVLQIRFKLRTQFKLLLQIRCLIILRTESNIISIDSYIVDNIIRKVINVQQEKSRSKNVALRNSSINWIFLTENSIQSHLKPLFPRKEEIMSNI